jgi:phage gp36-like protein
MPTALASAVQSRWAEDTIVQLTRRKDTVDRTVDLVVLELAVTDVTAQFEVYVGETFDATDAQHLTVACMGVIAKLKTWTRESPESAAADWKAWTEYARDLAKITSRNRVAVQTTSQLTPTVQVDPGETVRPVFDPDAFDGLQVGRP